MGFRNMEKIAPVRQVRRGTKVFPLPYAERELTLSYAVAGKTLDTAAFLERNDVAGLLVLRNGRIVLERYALGFDARSLWASFSVAKSVTSTLLGAAVAEGRIRSIDDAVTTYLPALKQSAYAGVTIRQVLNMTTGAKWNEDYSDPESDVNRCHRAKDRSLGSPLVTYLATLTREAEPGTKFVYKTAEADLAGEIVMAATGKSLALYLSEKIWRPFGMERDAYWGVRDDKELGGCCLSISLRDYARFALFFLGGGFADGKHVLPQDWKAEASTASSASQSRAAGVGYGFQWWVGADGQGTYTARGIFGQSIYVNPSENLVVVILSAWAAPTDTSRREEVRSFQDAIVRALRADRANW